MGKVRKNLMLMNLNWWCQYKLIVWVYEAYLWENMGASVPHSESGQSSPVNYSILSITWLHYSERIIAPCWRSFPQIKKRGGHRSASDWQMSLLGPQFFIEGINYHPDHWLRNQRGHEAPVAGSSNTCRGIPARLALQSFWSNCLLWAEVLGHETRVECSSLKTLKLEDWSYRQAWV